MTEYSILTTDDKKQAILQFVMQNPGVTSVDIRVGLSRSSIGAHLRALMVAGLLVQDASRGWHIADGYVVSLPPKAITTVVAENHVSFPLVPLVLCVAPTVIVIFVWADGKVSVDLA